MSDAIVSLPFQKARALGIELKDALTKHARLCQIVGALRRRDKLVSMIEVVVRPCLLDADLMGNTPPDFLRLERAVKSVAETIQLSTSSGGKNELRAMIKVGETAAGGIMQVALRVYILDDVATWAWAVMVHTGPSAFVVNMLDRLRRAGVEVNGMSLSDKGRRLEYADERLLFSHIGMTPIDPSKRRNPNGPDQSADDGA